MFYFVDLTYRVCRQRFALSFVLPLDLFYFHSWIISIYCITNYISMVLQPNCCKGTYLDLGCVQNQSSRKANHDTAYWFLCTTHYIITWRKHTRPGVKKLSRKGYFHKSRVISRCSNMYVSVRTVILCASFYVSPPPPLLMTFGMSRYVFH